MADETTDPSRPPAYALNVLHDAGYEPRYVEGGPTLYQRRGHPPVPWKAAIESIGEHYRDAQETVRAQALAIEDLRRENEQLRARPTAPAFIAAIASALPALGVGLLVTISEVGRELLPHPMGNLVAGGAAVLVVWLGTTFGHRVTSRVKKDEAAPKALPPKEEP